MNFPLFYGWPINAILPVLNQNIPAGHSGNCSNPEGARWLQHALGPQYQVAMVKVDKRFPHLDCVMLTPRA